MMMPQQAIFPINSDAHPPTGITPAATTKRTHEIINLFLFFCFFSTAELGGSPGSMVVDYSIVLDNFHSSSSLSSDVKTFASNSAQALLTRSYFVSSWKIVWIRSESSSSVSFGNKRDRGPLPLDVR